MASELQLDPASRLQSEECSIDRRRIHGGCLCGSVLYTVHGELRPVWQCHCVRCQKTTGNFMAASQALAADIVVQQFDALRWFGPHDDPNIQYGFCRRCGSSLFWRVVDQGDEPERWSICAGTFDDDVHLTTEAIWFADRAAHHTHLDPAAMQLRSTDL